VPECIISRSLVSDQVIIDTVVAKYRDNLPRYRQSAILKRDAGLNISFSTMGGWVMQVGDLLQPIVRAMRSELLARSYIRADEMPVGVQMHDKRGKNHHESNWAF
jgi:transposase